MLKCTYRMYQFWLKCTYHMYQFQLNFTYPSLFCYCVKIKINSQSLEDTQVGYISQKYFLDNITFWKIHFGSKKLFHQRRLLHSNVKGSGNSKVSFCENTLKINTLLEDICKKQCLGTSWMGWGPVDWVGRVLPEAK